MLASRLSIGGEITPCSQRAITERSRPVRSRELGLGQAGPHPRLPDQLAAAHDQVYSA